ncbi:MAG: hypothetical protein MZU97_05510 [Bacillus subtilis]|nr:hypothetical protein [Bacillus subtilis]
MSWWFPSSSLGLLSAVVVPWSSLGRLVVRADVGREARRRRWSIHE